MRKAVRFVALNPKDDGKLRSLARICIEVPRVAFRREIWVDHVASVERTLLSADLDSPDVRDQNQLPQEICHTLKGGGQECPPHTVKRYRLFYRFYGSRV